MDAPKSSISFGPAKEINILKLKIFLLVTLDHGFE